MESDLWSLKDRSLAINLYIKDSSMTKNVDSYVKDSEVFIFKWKEKMPIHMHVIIVIKKKIVLEVFLQLFKIIYFRYSLFCCIPCPMSL